MKKENLIIFGANGLIGKALVADLLKKGCNVIAADLNNKMLNNLKQDFESPKNLIIKKCDILKKDEICNVFKLCEKKFGKPDGCVNCTYPKNKNFGKDFFNIRIKDFISNLELHLGGYFLLMQQSAKYSLKENKAFSLVQFSSIYGVISPKFDIYKNTNMTSSADYAAIKSSIIHLTKYLTSYTKGSKFRVNCISPGGIKDNQLKSFTKEYNKISRKKGLLDANDLSGTVYYLLSKESEFVCGQNIVVDDAFSI